MDVSPDITKEEFALLLDTLNVEERNNLFSELYNSPDLGPLPGKQTLAFVSQADVVGYGGAAGGGKSALIALLATKAHKKSVIFRKDATQMKSLIDDIELFVGHSEGLNRQGNIFRIGGSTEHQIEWGGLSKPEDKNKWRGRPHDLIAFDEVTEMDNEPVIFLFTWNRSVDPEQRCRIIMTFNPPGLGLDDDDLSGGGWWVKDFFAPWLDDEYPNPAEDGELRYFVPAERDLEFREVPNGDMFKLKRDGIIQLDEKGKPVMVTPQSRTFISARVFDNKFLYDPSKGNTNYVSNLSNLPASIRDGMLYGIMPKGNADPEFQLIPTQWLDIARGRWSESQRQLIPMSAMGVDVARGGKNFTVLARRHELWFDKMIEIPGKETMDGRKASTFCIEHIRDNADICIDVIGVGSSPYDVLQEELEVKGSPIQRVYPVNGAVTTALPQIDLVLEMFNMRAQLYWLLRQLLNPANDFDISIPPDRKLRKQLLVHRYSVESNGKVKITSKDDLKSHLSGQSPDLADALVYSLFSIFREQPELRERILSQHIKKKEATIIQNVSNSRYSWMNY